ncbi:pentatricopeptide repeat-containing protein At5g66520-like [Impatiens glandulifera]|uniref:pentatricopeptide repeat-containing protein At5g66520-like n=1 Tax=Impatiens glandulifera TaxID=253017 RepID=UPI001FB0E1B4|nr:pentatricopeptide repeat-containing protein At5g66520-like [Impatiens glandulifera]
MFITKAITFRALQHTIFTLLQTCNGGSIRNVTQIHTQVIINGLTQKNNIVAKLISLYITSGFLANADTIFNQINNPSTTIWNQMIRVHGRSGNSKTSFEIYKQMESAKEAVSNGFTFSFLLSACARSGLLREGQQLHAKVVSNGFSSNLFVQTNLVNLYEIKDAAKVFDEMSERNVVTWNTLLEGYLRSNDITNAVKLFDEMPEKTIVSWTMMITGYARNGRSKQAICLFQMMQKSSMEFDQVSLVTALSACAEMGNLELGKWIHSYIYNNFKNKNKPLLVSLNNSLINMYSKCGLVNEAYNVFNEMPQRTSVSWTSMINGFSKHGLPDEALNVFHQMQSDETKRPDEITFIGVLSACSHGGYVEKGRNVFNSMVRVWGIQPRIEHYGCMVDLLSRAGLLEEAYNLVETMPMKANDVVWGALLGGCRIHKNVELGSRVGLRLLSDLDPGRAAEGYFVLLSHVYGNSMRWWDAARVRQKMAEMGMKTKPGKSVVELLCS